MIKKGRKMKTKKMKTKKPQPKPQPKPLPPPCPGCPSWAYPNRGGVYKP